MSRRAAIGDTVFRAHLLRRLLLALCTICKYAANCAHGAGLSKYAQLSNLSISCCGANIFCSLLSLSAQVVEDGYEFQAARQLVTLFSAPNYCGEFDNAGAMMVINEVTGVWP